MINTIEVAPGILAASLAKYLSQHYWVYPSSEADGDDYLSEHKLREIIRDFLTDKEKSETMLGH